MGWFRPLRTRTSFCGRRRRTSRHSSALARVWDDRSIDDISADDLLGDYPAVRYYPPSGDLYLDVLTRLGEAFAYEDLASQRIEIGGLEASVATPATPFALKRGTVRAADRLDAERLAAELDLELREDRRAGREVPLGRRDTQARRRPPRAAPGGDA